MALPSLRVTELRNREHYPGLLAAWGFNEGSGSTARDSSGNNRNLTVTGGVTWVAGHTAGTALSNTTTGSASTSWNLPASAITVMGWARPLDLTAGTNRALFGVWDTADGAGSTQLALWAQRSDFGTPNVLQGNLRVNGGLVSFNGGALTLNTWVHVALSFDGTTIRLYTNGSEVVSTINAGTIFSGAFLFNVVPNPSFAEADDIRVFSTALSAAQIVNMMNTPVAAP